MIIKVGNTDFQVSLNLQIDLKKFLGHANLRMVSYKTLNVFHGTLFKKI